MTGAERGSGEVQNGLGRSWRRDGALAQVLDGLPSFRRRRWAGRLGGILGVEAGLERAGDDSVGPWYAGSSL